MISKANQVLLRSVEDRADARALRAAIGAELRKVPMNEFSLRSAVDAFVETECRSGVPPAMVITRLAALVEDAEISSAAARLRLLRCVILWCVESYFGHGRGVVPPRSRHLPTPATAS